MERTECDLSITLRIRFSVYEWLTPSNGYLRNSCVYTVSEWPRWFKLVFSNNLCAAAKPDLYPHGISDISAARWFKHAQLEHTECSISNAYRCRHGSAEWLTYVLKLAEHTKLYAHGAQCKWCNKHLYRKCRRVLNADSSTTKPSAYLYYHGVTNISELRAVHDD